MVNFIIPSKGRITSSFGFRIHPIFNTKKMHWGVDYGNTPTDNDIISSADGTVERASEFGGYGNTVIITHIIKGVTYQTLYAHLASMSVKVGQKVKQGQKIGVKGTTGNSTGTHLHFEIHVGGKRNSNYTYAKDPLKYLADLEVLEVQCLLNKLGYKLTEDGISGGNTEKAIKDFQAKFKLNVDGLIGKNTLAKLKEATKPQPEKVTNDVFRIKTGTFPNAKALVEATEKLKKEFNWTVYEKADSTSLNPDYRIYTGAFSNKEDAEKGMKQLKDKFGWISYLVNETDN